MQKDKAPDTKGKALSVEELLKPRYKVIADYPGSNRFKMGAIFTRAKDGLYFDDDNNVSLESNLTGFPHLFKPLQWYEDRKPEEMPEYVRVDYKNGKEAIQKIDGQFFVTAEWAIKGLINISPATEADYITQNSKP